MWKYNPILRSREGFFHNFLISQFNQQWLYDMAISAFPLKVLQKVCSFMQNSEQKSVPVTETLLLKQHIVMNRIITMPGNLRKFKVKQMESVFIS